MKYILKKDLPLAKAGTEVNIDDFMNVISLHWKPICVVSSETFSEWLEKVNETKTIYDLKKGDTYWTLTLANCVLELTAQDNWFCWKYEHCSSFLTEREAHRNKLLRELATRTDKWLPKYNEPYKNYAWDDDFFMELPYQMIFFNQWLVFRNEEEYNKWMTPDNKKLLFEI